MRPIHGQGGFVQCRWCKKPCMWVKKRGRFTVSELLTGAAHRCRAKRARISKELVQSRYDAGREFADKLARDAALP